jgi:hypothetical protein
MKCHTQRVVISLLYVHHHHQSINAGSVPTAGAQTQHHLNGSHIIGTGHNSAGWLTTANAAGTNGLTCLPKHEGAPDNKFLVTRPKTDQRCLASTIARRAH